MIGKICPEKDYHQAWLKQAARLLHKNAPDAPNAPWNAARQQEGRLDVPEEKPSCQAEALPRVETEGGAGHVSEAENDRLRRQVPGCCRSLLLLLLLLVIYCIYGRGAGAGRLFDSVGVAARTDSSEGKEGGGRRHAPGFAASYGCAHFPSFMECTMIFFLSCEDLNVKVYTLGRASTTDNVKFDTQSSK